MHCGYGKHIHSAFPNIHNMMIKMEYNLQMISSHNYKQILQKLYQIYINKS